MTTRAVARLEIWDKLGCESGAKRLAFARDVTECTTVQSIDGDERCTFSLPAGSNAANAVSDLKIARVWQSDTDYDEWVIAQNAKTRGRGTMLSVTCWPVSYLLTIRGLVPEWQITNTTGVPLLDVGVNAMSATDILQTYLVDNTLINTVIPWLAVGTIDSSTLLSVNWSFASRMQVILAVRDVMQQADAKPYDFRLVRNGSTNYHINITAVA